MLVDLLITGEANTVNFFATAPRTVLVIFHRHHGWTTAKLETSFAELAMALTPTAPADSRFRLFTVLDKRNPFGE